MATSIEAGGEHWVPGLPQDDANTRDALTHHAGLELLHVVALDILSIDCGAGTKATRQADGVLPLACTDVRNPHPWLDAKALHHALGLSVLIPG